MYRHVLKVLSLLAVVPAMSAAQPAGGVGVPTLSPGGWLGGGIRYLRVQHHGRYAGGAGLGVVGGYTHATGIAVDGGIQFSLHAPRYGPGSNRNSLAYTRLHLGARYVTHPRSRFSAAIGTRVLLAYRKNNNSGRQTSRSGTGYGFSLGLLAATRSAWVELGVSYDRVAIDAEELGTSFDPADGFTSRELEVRLTFLVPLSGRGVPRDRRSPWHTRRPPGDLSVFAPLTAARR